MDLKMNQRYPLPDNLKLDAFRNSAFCSINLLHNETESSRDFTTLRVLYKLMPTHLFWSFKTQVGDLQGHISWLFEFTPSTTLSISLFFPSYQLSFQHPSFKYFSGPAHEIFNVPSKGCQCEGEDHSVIFGPSLAVEPWARLVSIEGKSLWMCFT
jgi:hypothetical protein